MASEKPDTQLLVAELAKHLASVSTSEELEGHAATHEAFGRELRRIIALRKEADAQQDMTEWHHEINLGVSIRTKVHAASEPVMQKVLDAIETVFSIAIDMACEVEVSDFVDQELAEADTWALPPGAINVVRSDVSRTFVESRRLDDGS